MSEYCTCATSFDGSCQLHDRIDALTTENAALRSRLAEADAAWDAQQDERSGLYKRLAEAEALLREARDEQDACISPGWKARIDAHLARKP